jgi:hypothetical protein
MPAVTRRLSVWYVNRKPCCDIEKMNNPFNVRVPAADERSGAFYARSPANSQKEYSGAINLPVFDDAERAKSAQSMYQKREQRRSARLKSRPKLRPIAETARQMHRQMRR